MTNGALPDWRTYSHYAAPLGRVDVCVCRGKWASRNPKMARGEWTCTYAVRNDHLRVFQWANIKQHTDIIDFLEKMN